MIVIIWLVNRDSILQVGDSILQEHDSILQNRDFILQERDSMFEDHDPMLMDHNHKQVSGKESARKYKVQHLAPASIFFYGNFCFFII